MGSELNVETMARIHAFCKKITAPMGLDEGIYRELCSHMEDKVRAYLDGSEAIKEADALLIVESHFGRQERVRALLQTANKGFETHISAPSILNKVVSRKVANLAAFFSLLCCIALGALWVRSYYVRDALEVCHVNVQPKGDIVHNWWFKSARGGLKFEHDISMYANGEGAKMPWWHRDTGDPTLYPFFGVLAIDPAKRHFTLWQQAGLDAYSSSEGTPPDITRGFILPLWLVVPLLLILPALRFRAYLRQKSLKPSNNIAEDLSIEITQRVVPTC